MIDGATDDQVRGLLDRHKARMARYVRWENWPVGECPPAGGRVKSGEVAPLPVVRLGIDCWLFNPDEIGGAVDRRSGFSLSQLPA